MKKVVDFSELRKKPEPVPATVLSVRVPRWKAEKLKEICRKNGITHSKLFHYYIDAVLRQEGVEV